MLERRDEQLQRALAEIDRVFGAGKPPPARAYTWRPRDFDSAVDLVLDQCELAVEDLDEVRADAIRTAVDQVVSVLTEINDELESASASGHTPWQPPPSRAGYGGRTCGSGEGMAAMTTTSVSVDLPILRKGSEGGTVLRLQQMLNVFVGHGEEGHPVEPLRADGVFGPKTEQAVKTFQGLDAGTLAVDGVVGPATWKKLLTMWLSGSEPG